MKYNLKNRPKYEEKMHSKSWALNDVECWFVGFEAELREMYIKEGNEVPKWSDAIHWLIKEILGEPK